MSYPWSALGLLALVYAIAVLYILSQSRKSLRRLYDTKASIITIASATVMVLFFGFAGISRGAVYYLVMLCLLTSMGLSLAADIHHIRQRRPASVLAHLGVFVVMATGIFGYADKQKVRITAVLDETYTEAVDDAGMRVELPFALTVRSFDIERYPAKLHLVDSTGVAQAGAIPVSAPGKLGGWSIEVLEYHDMAVRFPLEQGWREFRHTGADAAALVRAANAKGETVTSWVACGSFVFAPESLALPDGQYVTMSEPSPRRFVTELSVTDRKGRHSHHELSVNHPVRIGSWRIYQAGYDLSRGRWSTYSVLQCVRDPWYPLICTGLWLILAAAVVMVFTAGRRLPKTRKL